MLDNINKKRLFGLATSGMVDKRKASTDTIDQLIYCHSKFIPLYFELNFQH